MPKFSSSCWPSCGRLLNCWRPQYDDFETLTNPSQVTRKVVVVGDGAVGKTSLLVRYVTGQFDERYQPTIFDNQAVSVNVKKKTVLLSLFDTAGQEAYEHLRPSMYPDTDVVLVCFSVDSRTSLANVTSKWMPEVRRHLPKTPVLLLGLKTDLRARGDDLDLDLDLGSSTVAATTTTSTTTTTTRPLLQDVDNGDCLEMSDRGSVSYQEGQRVAEAVGARAYFECSARLNVGLTPIFLEAARLALKRRRGSSIRDLLTRGPRLSAWLPLRTRL